MLVGKKVILEEVDPKNIEQMRVWRNDPNLRKYFREYKDISKDQQDRWYKERGNNMNPAHVYFQIMGLPELDTSYPLQHRIDNRYLIGCCGLHYIDFRLRSGEFGVFLGTDRGTGKGKEAIELLFDYGFKELNLHKIWAEVYDNNDSINLYRKIGLRDDGILRDNYFSEGKYGNSTMMSVLENEWRAQYGEAVLWR